MDRFRGVWGGMGSLATTPARLSRKHIPAVPSGDCTPRDRSAAIVGGGHLPLGTLRAA
jgi:hypothetical protein